MILARKPSDQTITRFIESQSRLPFSYPETGATRTQPPSGFAVDHHRIMLGSGHEIYERATAALQQWKQFDLGWVSVVPSGLPIEVGTTVAVLAQTFGLWTLNACRIVYLVGEVGEVKRFGFAYGTLPDHVEQGEERFTIEWRQEDDSVWYDILAFSRPRHPLAKLMRPIVRQLQKNFARDSLARMRQGLNPERAGDQ
ncbi:MAG TPA: DUF1990 domain-containing protein [Pyrinomonadaceae bacterium]|nr:DUF1990 domain-containing protein [Pyrinomonadaceae bacterium]